MLRIRSTDGTVAPIHDQFRFVEIVDDSGKIAVLIYIDDAGAVKVVKGGEEGAKRYASMFKTEFCPLLPVKAPQ